MSSDANLCFVDSNVWLYAFIQGQDARKSELAKAVVRAGEIVVSTQIISEVCVNLIKKAKFSEPEVQSLIQSFYRRYRVLEINRDVLLRASELRSQFRLSYWDSTVVACALASDARILYSEDMDSSLTIEGQLKIINPFA